MRSKKNDELNFLYLDNQSSKKEKKDSSKKKSSVKPKAKSKKKEETQDVFNFDKEIVIGVTKLPSQKEKKDQNKKQVQGVRQSKNQNTKTTIKGADVRSAPKEKKQNRTNSKPKQKVKKEMSTKTKIVKSIIKWTILLIALVASFIFFMMSPLFNLVEISVIGNDKIGVDMLISLSELQIGENIYKTSSKKIEERIKQNAYIESVIIHRNLPNKIQIEVEERRPTYMLGYANSFVYLNNQGYMLEISEQKLELPIIVRTFNKAGGNKTRESIVRRRFSKTRNFIKNNGFSSS